MLNDVYCVLSEKTMSRHVVPARPGRVALQLRQSEVELRVGGYFRLPVGKWHLKSITDLVRR